MAIFAKGFIEVEDEEGRTHLVQVSKIRDIVDVRKMVGSGDAKSLIILEKKGTQPITTLGVVDDIQTIGILINRSKG